jgi:hypothetical protein
MAKESRKCRTNMDNLALGGCVASNRFAFTDSGVLLTLGIFRFDLRAVASSKRGTNGKLRAAFHEWLISSDW